MSDIAQIETAADEAAETTTAKEPTPGRTLTEAELIELADDYRGSPWDKLLWLAQKYLSALYPDRAQEIEDDWHRMLIEEFAKDLLRNNGYSSSLSYPRNEREQHATLAGIEPLLFAKADKGTIYSFESGLDRFCPECRRTNIEQRFTCPGYMMSDGLYSCSRGCTNAKEFTCTDCYWTWQTPLHEKSSRYEENEKRRTPWADSIF